MNTLPLTELETILQTATPAERRLLKKELLIEAARTDLGAYGTYLFDGPNSPHKPAPHHEEWIEVLNDPTAERIFIACPRGHAKTSWIGNAFPGFALGQNRNLRIGYISASEEQAESVSLVNKSLIEDKTSRYHDIFHNVKPDYNVKWTNTNWYTQRDYKLTHPTFFAAGIGGSILGKRFDLLVMDDVCDQKNMESPTLRKKTLDWVEATIEPCITSHYRDGVEIKPRIVIICTRWHEEDIYKWAVDYGGFEFLIQPALGHWERKRGIIQLSKKEQGQMLTRMAPHSPNSPITDFLLKQEGFEPVPDDPPEPDDRLADYNEIEDATPNTDTPETPQPDIPLSLFLTPEEVAQLPVTTKPLIQSSINEEVVTTIQDGKVSAHTHTRAPEHKLVGLGRHHKEDNTDGPPYHGKLALLNHGTALWPSKKSRDELLKDYRRNKTLFWKMSMQNPSSPAGNIFKRDWWSFYKKSETRFANGDILFIVFPWDTAFLKTAESDYSVGYSMVYCADGRIYITRELRDKFTFPELKKAVKRFYYQDPIRSQFASKTFDPVETAIVIEQKASGMSVKQSLEVETPLPVYGSPADTDKVTRANAVSWFAEAGRVVLPSDDEDAEWVEAFIDELAEFPNAKNDDRVDSCVHGLAFLIDQIVMREEENLVREMSGTVVHTPNNRESDSPIPGLTDLDGVTDPIEMLSRLNSASPYATIASPDDFGISGDGIGGVDLGNPFGSNWP